MMISSHRQEGTTLVEVLIAAIIIAIGLLGIATLQVKALQASTNAEHRANATDIAAALADRIRANLGGPPAFKGNHKNYVTTISSTAECPTANSCASDNSGTASACNPAAMADFDLNNIYCGLGGIDSKLPEGVLSITCDDPCDGSNNMHIRISWKVRNDVFGNEKDFIVLTFIPGKDPED
jgi:type IV pilus assembly protein PilV